MLYFKVKTSQNLVLAFGVLFLTPEQKNVSQMARLTIFTYVAERLSVRPGYARGFIYFSPLVKE